MADHSERLRLLMEKMLLHHGLRHARCRVLGPASGSARTYSVQVDVGTVRNQFFVQSSRVDRFADTDNEQHVLADIRFALRSLERMLAKKKGDR